MAERSMSKDSDDTRSNDDIPSIDYRARGFFNDRDPAEMRRLLANFVHVTGLENEGDIFGKGMYLAQHPKHFDDEKNPPEPGLTINRAQKAALKLDKDPVKVITVQQFRRLPRIAKPDFQKWHALPSELWRIVLVCAIGAMIQGMDEAAVNGSQAFYLAAFGIQINPSDMNNPHQLLPNPHVVGLINAAPYLCCIFSCWFTPLLNRWFGRRGTIFLCSVFSFTFAFMQAFAKTWQQLFIYRLLLGIGIGPKSATIPIYAAEVAPANIRGSLVTCWQAFTAFGIAIGCIVSLAFQPSSIPNTSDAKPGLIPGTCFTLSSNDTTLSISAATDRSSYSQYVIPWSCSWHWRIVLASPCILPIILFFFIYLCRESPRWTIAEAHRLHRNGQSKRAQYRYQKAFRDLQALSRNRLLAARDMFSHFYILDQEHTVFQELGDDPYKTWLGQKLKQLFGRRRNRRSIMASVVCMLAQQLCGVNIFIYYSNPILQSILKDNRTPWSVNIKASRHTMIFGIINFLLALPAFFLIDIVGRRTLLLATFPFLAISHFIAGMSLVRSPWSEAAFFAGFYLFAIFYSPGEGPVPFVYASESMPLYIREQGMGFVTSINWLLNWLVAYTAPYFWNNQHANPALIFGFYSVCCVGLWILILLLVPETRLLSLEQLDVIFGNIGTLEFARYAIHCLAFRLRLRKNHPGILYQDRRRTFSPGGVKSDGGDSGSVGFEDVESQNGRTEPTHSDDEILESKLSKNAGQSEGVKMRQVRTDSVRTESFQRSGDAQYPETRRVTAKIDEVDQITDSKNME